MPDVIEKSSGLEVPHSPRNFHMPRSRQTLKIGTSVINDHSLSLASKLPIVPINSDAAGRRHQVHHQDFRASAARGRSRQGLERAKAHLREARLSLEKGDIVRARQVTDKALQIARSASAASQLQGTPLGTDADNTLQEAISVAMYLSEHLENLDGAHGRFALSAAVGRALSRRLDANTKTS